jgi:hypothetical protein
VSPDDVVFVEGIRDSNALRLAGFRGRIVTLKEGEMGRCHHRSGAGEDHSKA